MTPDPYRVLEQRVRDAHTALTRLRAAADDDEALARYSSRDALRAAAHELQESAEQLLGLLAWADSSDLPPGLRASVSRPGAHELAFDPTDPTRPTATPNPLDAGEVLDALVYTDAMGAELVDSATLDVATLPKGPSHYGRVRLRAHAADLDPDAGPHEYASLYLNPAAARRLAALLRQSAVALQDSA